MVVPVMPVINHDLSNTLLKNTLNTECITLSMLNCKLNLSKVLELWVSPPGGGGGVVGRISGLKVFKDEFFGT